MAQQKRDSSWGCGGWVEGRSLELLTHVEAASQDYGTQNNQGASSQDHDTQNNQGACCSVVDDIANIFGSICPRSHVSQINNYNIEI
eukprot:scaffold712478_cov134-Attheya_sp.AAC.1